MTNVNLTELREAKGLKIKEMAVELDVSPSLISKLERGAIDLTPKMATKLSEYFGVEIASRKMVYKTVSGDTNFKKKKDIEEPLKKRMSELRTEKREAVSKLKTENDTMKAKYKAEIKALEEEIAIKDRKYALLEKRYKQLLDVLSTNTVKTIERFSNYLDEVNTVGVANEPILLEDETVTTSPVETDVIETTEDVPVYIPDDEDEETSETTGDINSFLA